VPFERVRGAGRRRDDRRVLAVDAVGREVPLVVLLEPGDRPRGRRQHRRPGPQVGARHANQDRPRPARRIDARVLGVIEIEPLSVGRGDGAGLGRPLVVLHGGPVGGPLGNEALDDVAALGPGRPVRRGGDADARVEPGDAGPGDRAGADLILGVIEAVVDAVGVAVNGADPGVAVVEVGGRPRRDHGRGLGEVHQRRAGRGGRDHHRRLLRPVGEHDPEGIRAEDRRPLVWEVREAERVSVGEQGLHVSQRDRGIGVAPARSARPRARAAAARTGAGEQADAQHGHVGERPGSAGHRAVRAARQSASTCVRRKHPAVWSLTSPPACMKA